MSDDKTAPGKYMYELKFVPPITGLSAGSLNLVCAKHSIYGTGPCNLCEADTLRALLAEALPHLEGFASVTGLPSVSDLVKCIKQANPA